jgi:predicted nucleic-acid-binding Zn-ribbon protein
MACVRCGIADFDHDMLSQWDGKEYHKELGDCIKCQSERITELEKQVAGLAKAISSVEATAEMLNAVVGRML